MHAATHVLHEQRSGLARSASLHFEYDLAIVYLGDHEGFHPLCQLPDTVFGKRPDCDQPQQTRLNTLVPCLLDCETGDAGADPIGADYDVCILDAYLFVSGSSPDSG